MELVDGPGLLRERPHALCLHFQIALLELLFGFFKRWSQAVVRGRSRKRRGVHGPNPPWRGGVFVNSSNRSSIIVDNDEIVFPPMVPPAHQLSMLVHRSQAQCHGGIL